MKALTTFFSEVYSELKKIQWPTRSDFLYSGFYTIVLVFLFSIFFLLVDTSIGYCLKQIYIHFT